MQPEAFPRTPCITTVHLFICLQLLIWLLPAAIEKPSILDIASSPRYSQYSASTCPVAGAICRPSSASTRGIPLTTIVNVLTRMADCIIGLTLATMFFALVICGFLFILVSPVFLLTHQYQWGHSHNNTEQKMCAPSPDKVL
jgi:hypothetical protein